MHDLKQPRFRLRSSFRSSARSRLRFSSFIPQPSSSMLIALSLLLLAAGLACRSAVENNEDASGVIVVNAPATGIVRRVLVAEGIQVEPGTAIVEIAVPSAVPAAAPSPGESAETRAVRNLQTSQASIDAARAEVVRHEAEVQRLTPLVASGEASQAQLDGERALYERAQQRLQQAQSAERSAETGLLAARQPGQQQASTASSSSSTAPREQLVMAQASSAGTVRVISVRAGDHVTSGQPVATMRANGP